MEICRACMNSNELFRLNDTYLESYNLLTNLSVRLGDSLPQFICKVCRDTVEAFTKFRKECINTENSLHSVVNEQVVKIETGVKTQDEDIKEVDMTIKQEFDNGDVDILFEDGNGSDTYLMIKAEEEENADLLCSLKGRPKRKCTKTKASPPAATAKRPKQLKKSTKKIKVKTGNPVSEIGVPQKVKQTSLNNTGDSQLLSCGLCKNKYDNRDNLYEHLEKHKQGTLCSICHDTFKTWPRLISHRVNHLEKRQWRCHLCWRQFPNEANVEYHYYKEHGDMKEFPGLQCKDCPKLFLNPLRLRKHAFGRHSSKQYICDHCSKLFNLKSALVSHLRSHQQGAKKYCCKPCGLSYKFVGGLKEHKLRKHSTTTVECKPCTRLFADQSKYDQHKCPVKPTICPVCGKKCATYKMYKSHIRIHTDTRYACSRCPASFKTSSNLRIHCDRHDGYRRYRCKWPGCSLAFYSGSVRLKHMRVHTGEKPFVCTVCNKGFTGNNNLKVHMRVHGMDLVKKRDADNSTNDDNFNFYN